jgi:Histidine kinase
MSRLTVAGAGDGGRRSGQVRPLRCPVVPLPDPQRVARSRAAPACSGLASFDDWRRLERDLHDGVQNELVALIVKLASAERDPRTPPALAEMLAELEARAQAALDSLRNVAHGIYPRVLADLGRAPALRAQAVRAASSCSGTSSGRTSRASRSGS